MRQPFRINGRSNSEFAQAAYPRVLAAIASRGWMAVVFVSKPIDFWRRVMKRELSNLLRPIVLFALLGIVTGPLLRAQTSSFHNAPASAKTTKNPLVADNRAP